MTVNVTLVSGLFAPSPGSPLTFEDIPSGLLNVAYDSGSVFAAVVGQPTGTFVAQNSATGVAAVLYGSWPSPLGLRELTDFEVDHTGRWLLSASGRTVERVVLQSDQFVLEIDFNGAGPTARDFITSWTVSDVIALEPTINGLPWGEEDTSEPEIVDQTIIGTAEDDDLKGGAGNDTIMGQSGDDTINAGAGNDTIYGNTGSNVLNGGGDDDLIFGHDERDILRGGSGDDNLIGNADNDRLFGGGGNDQLTGGDGNDLVRGGGGNDRFRDGAGNDRMFGQGGVDTFQFMDVLGRGGRDKIFGYNPEDDILAIQTADADPGIVSGNYRGLAARDAALAMGYEVTIAGKAIRIKEDDGDMITVRLKGAMDEEAFWDSVTWNFDAPV